MQKVTYALLINVAVNVHVLLQGLVLNIGGEQHFFIVGKMDSNGPFYLRELNKGFN